MYCTVTPDRGTHTYVHNQIANDGVGRSDAMHGMDSTTSATHTTERGSGEAGASNPLSGSGYRGDEEGCPGNRSRGQIHKHTARHSLQYRTQARTSRQAHLALFISIKFCIIIVFRVI